jgi:hypothetical protein
MLATSDPEKFHHSSNHNISNHQKYVSRPPQHSYPHSPSWGRRSYYRNPRTRYHRVRFFFRGHLAYRRLYPVCRPYSHLKRCLRALSYCLVSLTLTLVGKHKTCFLIRSIYDIGVGFDIAPGVGYPDPLGEPFASEVLGQALSSQVYPVNFAVQLPSGYPPQGPVLLSAALLSLYGVDAEPVIGLFNVSVTIETVTSVDTVSRTLSDY